MLQQAPKAESQNTISPKDAEAWLKKHGNGMDKIQRPEVQAKNFWARYGKVSTRHLVSDYFNHFDVLVPSEIPTQGMSQNIHNMCQKKVKAGELVQITITKKIINPSGGKVTRKIQAFKRA